MAWAKVDDGWWCHPKVIGLSLAACGLWIKAVSWSCAQRRDTVPTAFLAMVGGSKDEANELADAGLWVECDAGWRIHDWAHYQDRSTSEKRAEAGRKGGEASGRSRSKGEANEANAGSKGEAKAEAGPSRPVPSLPDPTNQHHPHPTPTSDPVDKPDDDDSRKQTRAPDVGEAVAAWAELITDRRTGVADPSSYAAKVRAGIETVTRERLVELLADGYTPAQAAESVAGPAPEPQPVDPTGRGAAHAREQATRNRTDASRATVPADAHIGAARAKAALRHEAETR